MTTANLKLFMVMLGATPKGRLTEQHDIFFGIGNSLKELVPEMKLFWPEGKGTIHIDCWREVTVVDNHKISIVPKNESDSVPEKLFFLNLGGYKENEFEEYHYKLFSVAKDLEEATKKSRKTAFYKHYKMKGAASHVDERFGIDVDDIYKVDDILSAAIKEKYALKITPSETILEDDPFHIGYVILEKLAKS